MSFPKLSGAEIDVLYKLAKHSPIEYNDVPSKSGRASLIEKGYATTIPELEDDGGEWLLFLTPLGMRAYKYGIETEWH
ncbi:MAG: hypothetical protein RR212_00450 [Bacteroidales bacterium]